MLTAAQEIVLPMSLSGGEAEKLVLPWTGKKEEKKEEKETYQMTAPIWMDTLLPNLSESKPEASEPTQEPPGMDAVMPP